MPAIDIGQIRGESAELARLFGDPASFALATREFFHVHSVPTYKQSLVVSMHAPLKTLGTPAPVLRTLLGVLRKVAAANPLHTLAVAERLWADPVREQRRLAVSLLGLAVNGCPPEAEAVMHRWLFALDDLELINLLAAEVCSVWLTGDLYTRIEPVRQWVNSPHKYQRQFGVMALAAAAKNRSFRDVSAALGAMTGVMRENDPEVRKSVAHALRDLSANGPGEVARFLGEWADTVDKNTNWIVRHAMEKLDADTRTALTQSLRGGRSGDMV
ncbi:MAG: DNA alkylation repair protein [Chloroflexi bacterium]|nr:DNA alkylation repair protein [Chloroflexota bacterium]